MNNDELKKKIIETLEKGGRNFLKSKEMKVSIYEYYADALIAAGIGDAKDLQAQVNALEMTDIALQAGYDGAEKDRLYWVNKYKEAEHRAEVAEKMFDILHEESSMYMKVFSKEWYKQQAEKELAEEKDEQSGKIFALGGKSNPRF